MAHLLRIVMIHGHLDGVVELSVDGHTNICGTNASGKTTLQRLVPVFYGELPNKVVPRTRRKFDAFYLPHRNSYLVYEYRREAGSLCQAVLTRRPEGGVEYRFVAAPYRPEDYLVEGENGIEAREYADWASGLRRSGTGVSAKLSATSEYRAVIQNDFTPTPGMALHGNRKEALKLRQLAAQYSLVAPEHRIRHIEKLVSAVHAKEGKMDTLKTMLAAIFEEDGVELPVTRIRGAKAREWIDQMRQSMRLAPLQRALARLQGIESELAHLDTTLWQLKPQLAADQHRAERTLAEAEQTRSERQRDFDTERHRFETTRDALNDRFSEADSALKQTQRELDDLQQQFEAFDAADMPALEEALTALPQARERYEQYKEHLRGLQEMVQASQAQKEERLRELGDTLARQSEETQALIDALSDEKATQRERHWEAKQQRDERFQRERQALEATCQGRLTHAAERLAVLKAALDHGGPTAEESEEAALAQGRVDRVQAERNAAASQQESLRQELSDLKRERDAADQAHREARQAEQQAQEQCRELERQRDPAQGTLRHFLRYHAPGWEQRLGKVIAPALLERRDLSPTRVEPGSDDLFGIALDTLAIDAPPYAQAEAELLAAIDEAGEAALRAQAALTSAEKTLKRQNERVAAAEQALARAHQTVKRQDEELEYASEARRQCQARHAQAQRDRQRARQAALDEQQALHQALKEERDEALEALHGALRAEQLELEADAQHQQATFERRLEQYRQSLGALKADHQRQCREVEAAFEQALEEQGVDPVTVKQTKARLAELEAHIRATQARQEELEHYRYFMRVSWGQRKPELSEQESRLAREVSEIERQRLEQRQAFKAAKAEHERHMSVLKTTCGEQTELLDDLKPLTRQLDELALPADATALSEPPGDAQERITRTRQALAQRSQERDALRKGCQEIEGQLVKGASAGFVDALERERDRLDDPEEPRALLPILAGMLKLLEDQQQQLVQQGRNLSDDLDKFFTVFSDLNRRISAQSKRLSDEVADDLALDGIKKAEVRIQSTIDELGFWEPLKRFAQCYKAWKGSQQPLPSDDYLDALGDVADLLRHDQPYSFESLLRLELHLNEGGTDLVIRSDRQLLESSSHGMAYLILCKFLLAFTRLLRGRAEIAIHWPIDEIGTLAYHNVEKLFEACDSNRIHIVGAFPNPESDVLLLFHNRYLIDRDAIEPGVRRLKRIEPRLSRLAERLKARDEEVTA
ncbi:ATP-binding protein [Halomonas sp. 707D7]|uniref:ATP-binding protein n=4 Tax=unclassified Halomonas TaxID=2609666 RepID=UPI0020A01FF8|nr:ATP-binding protein [Halomonas sp. 707D7]MCP1313086.1 ATP-binding protein [Halomonas sp. 707D7]